MNLSEIRIDPQAMLQNLAALKALTAPETKICAVIKGNAYGHGLPEVIQILDDHVDYFQVDDLLELRDARTYTRKPVLVLGYIPRHSLSEAIDLGCELGVFDIEHLAAVGQAATLPVRVHLKLDALLGRLGTLPSDLPALLDELKKYPHLELAGIYAHYANIEDTTDLTHAEAQRDLLTAAQMHLQQSGLSSTSHISATSGLMTTEASQPRGMVRLGIGIYGMFPSIPLSRTHASIPLKPALTWVSHLAQVKTLPAKHPIGYGLTYVTSRPTKIGIVPQGYSDGYDRGLSNTGEVLVRGQRCPVLGRIAMNMFAIDLEQVPDARAEDEVVLIGQQGTGKITAEDLAAKLGTINYEITSRIGALLPRTIL